MAFGINELVLERMFEAGQLRHPHLVAMRFEEQAAQDVGEVRAEFAPLDGMTPELAQGAGHALKRGRNLGLAAGDERNESVPRS